MLFRLPTDFEWIQPWHPLDEIKHAAALEGGRHLAQVDSGQKIGDTLNLELRREISIGHGLYGTEFDAVAYCSEDPSEFLFTTNLLNFPLACVHLTWRVESDVLFPRASLYSNVNDWISQMRLENSGCRHGGFMLDG